MNRHGVRAKNYFSLIFYYSLPIFLGSFLLFLLEPLYAKLILPWFGGSASVWIICLVFFQSALLLGYGYADIVTRKLAPFHQAILHVGLLAACLFFLPITPNPAWRPRPGVDPTWLILGLLTTQIGLPFVLLSATSPLLQSWYSRLLPGKEPYVLFALSNAASLLALVAFPFLIEPNLSSSRQVTLWSGLFILFMGACSLVAWKSSKAGLVVRLAGRKDSLPGASISIEARMVWIGLSACGSMLLLSITNHLNQDVAAVPLLWILPLSLYLLSFVIVFSRHDFYSRKWTAYLTAATLVFLNYVFYDASFLTSLSLKIIVLCAGLFIVCLFCHGELAHRKPAARHLTSYYLMISTGGALGAIGVGLVAPQIFSGVYEYPLALILTAIVALFLSWRESQFNRAFWGIILIFLALVLAQNTRALKKESLVMVRNFYAPLRVVQQESEAAGKYMTLCNGVVVHGKQFLDPKRSMEGTAYYSSDSGAGLAVRFEPGKRKRVGLVGLGAGTLAAFGQKGDVFRFYEINPQVIDLASAYFSFLRKSQASIEMVVGDARLSLEDESAQDFDVLAVDAFSGDAIPVHLLTKEAFALYLRHLKPEGILAFHTSNLYLDLAPEIQRQADQAGYLAIRIKNEKNADKLIDSTEWILVTRNEKFLAEPYCRKPEAKIEVSPDLRLWTDDDNSLFAVFKK